MDLAGVRAAWRIATRRAPQRVQLLGEIVIKAGAVPATGGALFPGAGAHEKCGAPTRWTAHGLGVAILATSRPFEGAVLCVPVAATLLLWWLPKKGPELKLAVRNAIVPLILCVALTGAMTGYYDLKLTGHALLLPYQLNERTYFVSPLFIFQRPRPQPAYRNDALRDFYLSLDLPQFEETQSLRGLFASWYDRFQKIWLVLLGPILTLPLVLALFAGPHQQRLTSRDWRNRFLLWGGLLFVAALAVEVYGLPHYAAPAVPLLIFAVLLAMRRVRRMRFRGKQTGLFLSHTIPLACLLMFVLRAAAAPLHIDVTSSWPPTWYNSATESNSPNRLRTNDRSPTGQTLSDRLLQAGRGSGNVSRVGLQRRRHRLRKNRLGLGHGRRKESGADRLFQGPRHLESHHGRNAGSSRQPHRLQRRRDPTSNT